MKKTLSRYGNSLALIIDKPILELLRIKDDTVLTLSTDGTQLIITPEHVEETNENIICQDPKLQKLIEDALDEYSEALQDLADK